MHRAPARYLVLLDADGTRTALLFTAERAAAGDFDATSEEVAVMTRGLVPARGASDAEWDRALAGSSRADRAAALVYTLDI